MRVVVTGNWVAIEAYGINPLEKYQTESTHTNTHTHLHNVQKQLHKDGGRTDGVEEDNERSNDGGYVGKYYISFCTLWCVILACNFLSFAIELKLETYCTISGDILYKIHHQYL